MAPEVAADVVLADPPDDLLGADDRAAERLSGEHRRPDEVVHLVLGIVLVHGDLLEHDLAFLVEVEEPGALEHVGQHRHRLVQMAVEDAGVEDGVVASGGGVELAAEAVEELGDPLGRV